MVIIYMISSFFRRSPTTPTAAPGKDGKPAPQTASSFNVYQKDLKMDMYVYLSEDEFFTDFDNKKALFWLEEELSYGDWIGGDNKDGSFEMAGKIETPENVMNNGTLFLHAYFVEAGMSPNPKDKDNYNRLMTVHRTKQLNKYKKRKFHTTTNLLTGTTDVDPDLVRLPNETTVEVLSHWHPNLTINLVDDQTPWMRGAVPAPLDDYIEFIPGQNNYYPILYLNDYWNLNSDYQPINETCKTLNLTLTYYPLSLFKWQMYAAQSMRNKWSSMLGGDLMPEENDDDQDSLKQAFLDTNPILLGVTIVVSIIHSIFEFLAFKNDIQFWRNRKSLEGLSVRSVFFNVFQSVIVLLYVLDNETNTVIKISCFVGLVIEIWKINKVIDVRVNPDNPSIMGFIPRLQFQDKGSYEESGTKEFDRMAFKYLGALFAPLAVGYCVYSVIYNEHKGWYSFILSSCYGFLLTFGFIMMTPQLFINYKLKSVAHLPWRMMTYKALNTFIDDIFAFVIKMPTMYRIGCFRDDIIFLIYVYQKYTYRVDHSRVNEFGFSGDMLEEAEKKKIEGTTNGEASQSLNGGNQNALVNESVKKPKSAKAKKSD